MTHRNHFLRMGRYTSFAASCIENLCILAGAIAIARPFRQNDQIAPPTLMIFHKAMSTVLCLDLATSAATEAFGQRLALLLRPGDVVALEGPLGVGKSTLARAVIQTLMGAEITVPSPTFTLVQTYDTPQGPLWHVDAYRLSHPEEALELGLEDAFFQGITLIEWPEKLGEFLPTEALGLRLEDAGAGRRLYVHLPSAWQSRREILLSC